jgi:hypothetical protein
MTFRGAVGSEAEDQIHNVPWLNPFRKISVGHGLAVCRCIHGPRQNDICSQARVLIFKRDRADQHRKSSLKGDISAELGMRFDCGQTPNGHNSPFSGLSQMWDRRAQHVKP